ncbi:InlB B-repeat-containing protein, partial [Methanimicrococcus blatticola]
LKAPTKEGYTFEGWYTDSGLQSPVSVPAITQGSTGAQTFYAKWTLDTGLRTLTYHPNGGLDGINTTEVIIPDLQANDNVQLYNETEVNFANTGYTLIGWSETANPTPTDIDYYIGSLFTMPAKNVNLYAVWGDSTVYTYSINYHPNGADNANTPVTIYYDDKEVVKIANATDTGFTKAGHVLGGWNEDQSQNIDYIQDETKNMTAEGTFTDLYAVWFEGVYKVTYTTDASGDVIGNLPAEVRYNENDRVPVEDGTHLIRIGYEFNGWDVTPPVEVPENNPPNANFDHFNGDGTELFYMPASDVVLKANWTDRTSDSFTVTYNGNGYTGTGIPIDGIGYQYNENVTVQSHSMDYSGYIFKGWAKDQAGSGDLYKTGDTFRITENTVLYAQWYKSGGNGNGNGTGSGEVIDPMPVPPKPPIPPEPPEPPEPPTESADPIASLLFFTAIAIYLFIYVRRDQN